MTIPITEEQIRTLAFSLWEGDGSPEGRSGEFWAKARQQLGAGDGAESINERKESDTEGDTEQTRPLSE